MYEMECSCVFSLSCMKAPEEVLVRKIGTYVWVMEMKIEGWRNEASWLFAT